MLSNAASFDQPINSWDMSSNKNTGGVCVCVCVCVCVVCVCVCVLFLLCRPLGHRLATPHLAECAGIFSGAESFNHPIDSWKKS